MLIFPIPDSQCLHAAGLKIATNAVTKATNVWVLQQENSCYCN